MNRRRGSLTAAGAALVVAAFTKRGRGRDLDDRLFDRLNSGLEHPALDRIMAGVTELGSIVASVTAAGVLTASGRRREALDATAAAAAMWWLGQVLKRRYGRPRPFDGVGRFRLLIDRPHGTSWPSSHPAVFLTFVTVVARDLGLPPVSRRALYGLAGVVAASRVYVGVHYPSDVAGGLLLGRATANAWGRIISPLLAPRPALSG